MGIKSWVKGIMGKILKPITGWIDKLKKFFNDLKNAVKKLRNAIIKFFEKFFDNLFRPILKPIGVIADFIESIFAIIFKVFDFFFNLVEIFIDLMLFGVKFIEIMVEIAKKIGYYIFKPFELMIVLIKLVITFYTFSICFVYHTFSLPNNLRILEWMFYMVMFIPLTFIMGFATIWYFVVYKLFFEYIFLYNIDKSTDGFVSSFMYRYFLACENSPEAWYMTPSYHEGNKNNKYVLAFNMCPEGYATNSVFGLFCERNNNYELTTCPQANLYRVNQNLEPVGETRNKDFEYDSKYMKKSSLGKSNEILNYKSIIEENNEQCKKTNVDKETLLKSICNSYDINSTKNNSGVTNQICYDLYCRNNSKEPFCHKLSFENAERRGGKSQNSELIIYLFVIIALLVLQAVVKLSDKI